jgi:hypothetical protein
LIAGEERKQVKRRSGQRSALERRVWQLIDDIREALSLGEPGAVDAIDQLELGARALRREQQSLVEDADRHREADDEG